MAYDPFARGPYPVGVRSGLLTDAKRNGRSLPFELWYPASLAFAGQDQATSNQDDFEVAAGLPALRQAAIRDATPRRGLFPLICFSHTSGGHRRQSSFLCTHLASHGYLVAAPDHTDNTGPEIARRIARAPPEGSAERRERYQQQIIADRVPDIRFLLDSLLAGFGHVAHLIDAQRIGLVGWSFGGWAVLATPEADGRIRAIVALTPGGNSNPLPGTIPAKLTFVWKRAAPTLFLAAELDRFTPLPGVYELYDRTPAAKRIFILRGADHMHFGDSLVDQLRLGLHLRLLSQELHDELLATLETCSQGHAQTFTRGLALAHLDANLKDNQRAKRFLANPVQALGERGVRAA
jgi:predicted dienelactone hydrolase